MKKRNSLMFRFSMIFLGFAILALLVTGFATYFLQMDSYKKVCQDNIQQVGGYLAELMKNEGDDIPRYQDYFMNHFRELKIPVDFEDYGEAYEKFETLFAKEYPGKVLGVDIELEETTPEVQQAYFEYSHEYWLLTFETASESFGLAYAYYLVPDDERGRLEDLEEGEDPDHSVVYLIDAMREPDEDDNIYLGITTYNEPERFDIMWKTWETGEQQEGFMEWDNEFGHTYGCFTPLIIDGELLGLIVTEIDYYDVNDGIMFNTLREMGILALVLLGSYLVILLIIRARFIVRTARLERVMYQYSVDKDPEVLTQLRINEDKKNEIDMLAIRFTNMIHDLTDYMDSLVQTKGQLKEAEAREIEMSRLASRDSLTGVRNKMAYDFESSELQGAIDAGGAKFGIAVIDMNYLKKINDKYGHDYGNIAISSICNMICNAFKHSAVFRIGGDEFVVILVNEDYDNVEIVVDIFLSNVADRAADTSLNEWERPTAAIGYSLFNPDTDRDVNSVFKRADNQMYEHKKQMHAGRE